MSSRTLSPEELERFAKLHNKLDRRYVDDEVYNNDGAWRSMSYDEIIHDHLDEASDGAGSRPVWIAAAHMAEMYDYTTADLGITRMRLKEIQGGDFASISLKEREVLADVVRQNMDWFNNNTVGMGHALTKLYGASPEQLASFNYLMELNGNSKNTLQSTWNMAWQNTVADPLTIVSLGTAKVAAKGVQMGVTQMLKQGIAYATRSTIQRVVTNKVATEAVELGVKGALKRTMTGVATSWTAHELAAHAAAGHIIGGEIGEEMSALDGFVEQVQSGEVTVDQSTQSPTTESAAPSVAGSTAGMSVEDMRASGGEPSFLQSLFNKVSGFINTVIQTLSSIFGTEAGSEYDPSAPSLAQNMDTLFQTVGVEGTRTPSSLTGNSQSQTADSQYHLTP